MKRYPILLIVLILPAIIYAINHVLAPILFAVLYGYAPFLALLKMNLLFVGIVLALLWRMQMQDRKNLKGIIVFLMILLSWVVVAPNGFWLVIGSLGLIIGTRMIIVNQSLGMFIICVLATLSCGYVFLSNLFFSLTTGVVLFLLAHLILNLWSESPLVTTKNCDKFWQAHQMAKEVLKT